MIKRVIFAILGSITFVLGTIGIFLPILPTAPFYIATTFFWVNSSERLHQFLLANKYYKRYVQEMIVEKKMGKKGQRRMISGVCVMLLIPFILVDNLPMRISLIAVALGHIIFLPKYFKSKKQTANIDESDITSINETDTIGSEYE